MPPFDSSIRAIAFYLPQYHPIPENDLWWGKGFTEWRNVTKARPNFIGHEQPNVPGDLGYYDLRVAETRAEQAALASQYGIHGFCYYYYWFAGKRLLIRPLLEMLESGEPDFPFCLCWANENWTRTWDGNSENILIQQKHSEADHKEFIRSLFPFFKDGRYIRVNGRPLLLIYRQSIIPDISRAIAIWREECALAGIEDPYIVAVQTFAMGFPTPDGFDAAVEFPPHGVNVLENCNEHFQRSMLNDNFNGWIVDLEKYVDKGIQREKPDYVLFRGVMPRWDNTARRQDNGLIFINSSPELYQDWLTEMLRYTRKNLAGDERLVFINAWNEWAEGCYLEPDLKYGHAYLEATQAALDSADLKSQEGAQGHVEKPRSSDNAQSVAMPGAFDQRKTGARLRVLAGVSWLYRKIPVSRNFKNRIASVFYKTLPFVFKGMAGYEEWKEEAGTRSYEFPALSAKPVVAGTAELARKLLFPVHEQPLVSVIVPVFNHSEFTLNCLASIQDNLPEISFELIVVDDCSKDDTPELLALVQGIRVIRNDENLGFLQSCNIAAAQAKGEYLLFLNNDTQVLPRWLDALYQTFVEYENVGLAGSKLLFPNGRLQEAGGIIFNDASGTNYGRGKNSNAPAYNYVREVDYCSGASIMIPKRLFEKVGQFDALYQPAYYEDTDLAFAVRQAGYRVLYQPFSIVFHFEGVTSGTDLHSGVKKWQVINKEKFRNKWAQVLSTHGAFNDDIQRAKERQVAKRALVMDWSTPKPDKDSGSIDTVNYIRMLQTLGFKVNFCPNDLHYNPLYTPRLQRMGVECLYEPFISSLKDYLKEAGDRYDLVILQRVHFAAEAINAVRKYCHHAKIIFNTVDLHYIREERQADIENSRKLLEVAAKTKMLEYKIMEKSDATVVISDYEKNIVLKEAPHIQVATIPYTREAPGSANPYEARRNIAFIGDYKFAPNADAVFYFIKEIWPLVLKQLEGIKFLIVGSITPAVAVLKNEPGVEVVGFVEQLGEVLDHCRLTIAPLRFGAGIKGKVGTSLAYGVPCVGTPLAAEGLGLTDGKHILLGDSPEEIANAIVAGYLDESLWKTVSKNGLEFFRKNYSFEQGLGKFRDLLENQLHMQADVKEETQ